MASSLYIIDPRLADYQTLIAGLPEGSEWWLLDPLQDGILQLQTILQSHAELDALHILSHGEAGTLLLGSTVLTADSIEDYAASLCEIGSHLSSTGDILLYGCDVGQGDLGTTFLGMLADMTGADVAASDDLTGAAGLGGDWVLEVAAGNVVSALEIAAYEGVMATGGNDVLTGTEGDDTLSGLGGNDTLSGLDGNDLLDGGADDDTLDGGAGNDTLNGGDGNDTLYSGTGIDQLDGGVGDDWLYSDPSWNSAAGSTFSGGSGDDQIVVTFGSGQAAWAVDGGDGHDVLDITAGSYDLSGVTDVESIVTRTNTQLTVLDANIGASGTLAIAHIAEAFTANDGQWRVDASAVTSGNLTITALNGWSSYGDEIVAGAGQDVISTLGGDDTIRGGLGDDQIDGGAGTDTAIFSGNYADYTITEDNINGLLIVTGPDGTDTLKGINRLQFDDQTVNVVVPGVTLTGSNGDEVLAGGEGSDTLDGLAGNDSLTGDAGNDSLTGGDGNDTVDAGSGDDLIVGGHGGGDDIYIGGSGIDTVRYWSARAAITVDLALGFARSTAGGDAAGIGTDQLTGIENVLSGRFDDTIRGNDAGNVLNGGNGNDRLYGALGNDTLIGGAGDDLLHGGGGFNTASYGNATAGVHVDLGLTSAQNTLGGGMDTLLGITSLTGSTFDDTLIGNASANTLNGGSGADLMQGLGGNDTYFVNVAGDIVEEALGDGIDTVRSAITFVLADNVERLILEGTGAINGTGNAMANTLTGNGAANVLSGGDGGDTLLGGAGGDRLIGGNGRDLLHCGTDGNADTIVLSSIADSATGTQRDVVYEFVSGTDRIDLSGIDANAGLSGDQAFAFSASGAAAFCVWVVDNGANLTVQGDVNGDGTADFEIRMIAVNQLVAGDFVL